MALTTMDISTSKQGLAERVATLEKSVAGLGQMITDAKTDKKAFDAAKELKRLYIDKGMSVDEIGAKYNVSARTIERRLSKYGITRRLPW
jgi:DNA invertase Pin-like site-specific DNA recombinase